MTTIDILAMPVEEKLKLMETLWDSLCIQSTVGIEYPAWHGEVLEERLQRIARGAETMAPWKEAKERIRAQAKAH